MTEQHNSLGAAHFDRLYAASDDPWHFRTSDYERAKYAATLAALPPQRFTYGLEAGCAIGELTVLLAARCDRLLGLDIAAAPLRTARARCAALPHVAFEQMAIPGNWPQGRFDLIVLSEVLYFLSPDDVRATAARVRASLAENGVVLLVNWLGGTDDPGTGDSAAEGFIAAAAPAFQVDLHHRTERYRLDRLTHT